MKRSGYIARRSRLRTKTPLRAKTPLRSTTRLRTGKPLKRTKRIKPMSDKFRAKLPARKTCLEAVRRRCGGKCEARVSPRCTGRFDHGHEPRKRARGADITDPAQVVAVCWLCDDWISHNEAEATRRGLLIPKNKAMPEGAAA